MKWEEANNKLTTKPQAGLKKDHQTWTTTSGTSLIHRLSSNRAGLIKSSCYPETNKGGTKHTHQTYKKKEWGLRQLSLRNCLSSRYMSVLAWILWHHRYSSQLQHNHNHHKVWCRLGASALPGYTWRDACNAGRTRTAMDLQKNKRTELNDFHLSGQNNTTWITQKVWNG